ncbi:MAG: hypothetical protein UW41_C0037G0011 [Candidatus Collierbacteria bacterium GW2011_GWC2_44_18]|uniref:Uncharacterized protein n=1 Tax=Candidatus Collierbacteria bacterium GW2011_GWC2_44_18 TaxID=1618392 RepID=A0A0G1HM12_9BACT|nr:MAG: hypothetical protein UW41_C0037G0011 [Candidatus Collierbacteria bacterium GW2011_GWC2_44_18]
MTYRPGPQGTGASFLRKVAELKAKGHSDLKARRMASGVTKLQNNKRRK